MEEEILNTTKMQKVIAFATSQNVEGAVELLKLCRTQLTTVIADDQFQTLVNAVTLEKESDLIGRLIVEVDKIKQTDYSTIQCLNKPQS